ncbi:MAG: hypothetical protein M0R03_21540 [Novosphingobium sp.]|nr:hypothetical protein [Novosphingobium sp.]
MNQEIHLNITMTKDDVEYVLETLNLRNTLTTRLFDKIKNQANNQLTAMSNAQRAAEEVSPVEMAEPQEGIVEEESTDNIENKEESREQ